MLSQPDTAGNGKGSSIIHDELRDHARTSTTALLEGDIGTQVSGCDPQPSQTSDPSYITAKVLLNPNKPKFISKVSQLSSTTMLHKLPASFGGSLGLALDGLQGGLFQPKLSFEPMILQF